MSVQQYAIVSNGIVINVVLWDGKTSTWEPPINSQAIQSDTASIGDYYANETFTKEAP